MKCKYFKTRTKTINKNPEAEFVYTDEDKIEGTKIELPINKELIIFLKFKCFIHYIFLPNTKK